MVRYVCVDPNKPKRCQNCGYGLGQFGVEFCEEYCSLDCFTSAKVTGRIYLTDPKLDGKRWQAKPWPRGLVLEAPPSPKPWRARTAPFDSSRAGRNGYSRRVDGVKRMQTRIRPMGSENRPSVTPVNNEKGCRGSTAGITIIGGGNSPSDGDQSRHSEQSTGRNNDESVDVPGTQYASRNARGVGNSAVDPMTQRNCKTSPRNTAGDVNRRDMSSDEPSPFHVTVSRQRALTTKEGEPPSVDSSSDVRRRCASGPGGVINTATEGSEQVRGIILPSGEPVSTGSDSQVVYETATSDEQSRIPEEKAHMCRIVRPTARVSSTRQAVRQWRHLFLP